MEDKYIRLLKQTKEDFDSNSPINFDQFKKRLEDYKIKADPQTLWFHIYNPATIQKFGFKVMGLDAYFKLLEYEELNEARKDSKQARREAVTAVKWAKYALIVSSVLAFIQIIIAIFK